MKYRHFKMSAFLLLVTYWSLTFAWHVSDTSKSYLCLKTQKFLYQSYANLFYKKRKKITIDRMPYTIEKDPLA